jgi:transcription termination factor Rho
MAVKPSPDRSDLESKTREDLQTIAKVKGVDISARASKASLIEAIMGDPAPAPSSEPSENGSRAVRSRRTVATPTDDFDDLLGEFVADASADRPAAATPTDTESTTTEAAPAAPSSNGTERQSAPRQNAQPRQDRQPRDFGNDTAGRNRRNRRNRNGRERFGGDSMPNADQPYAGELIEIEGLLDLRDDGYGFLRTKSYHPSPNDVYVSINQVRRYHLRKGDTIVGGFRPAASNEKYPALLRVDSVAGLDPEVARLRPRFEDLTPLFPDEKLNLELNEGKTDLTPRIVDLLSPIGKGQRGLIVSPPKAGKTTIMKQIAQSIESNNPEVHLMVLLVDERPEEVTDIRRTVKGEVIASTFDRPAEEHTHVAELCIERAKRLVEQGRDVVIILDGITRLARAYNLAAPATGRIMSGGVDSGALYPPKKFFGAARNIEEGGSLTIIASALVETGSKMDEVIFEEFKGTGNMELRLDRRLAERRIYPAIDVNASSTRHEELLFSREALPQVWKLRRVLNGLASEGREAAGLELLIDKLKSTKSNDEFLAEIARGPASTS